ncbi:uncharacterized protein [Drosophila suzukii]|uniref:PiggyBac transposable element-derived protein 4 C-terminal zinc-ribbon domain-containing protein n=1 Tax=Drosophila suzukii TaxID=28584 RepID=A0ABM4TV81_DROSZ
MSDEQLPHLQPWVFVENHENSWDMTVDRPMSPPPEEIVEAREMVEVSPILPEPEATIPVTRRSATIASREKTRKELQNRSSEPKVNTKKTKRGKLQKPRKARSGKHGITCRNCGNSLICPVRTKYYTCAEVDGQLFKVKQISAKVALNYILKK